MSIMQSIWRVLSRVVLAVPMLLAACDFRTVTRGQEKEGVAIDIYGHSVHDLGGELVPLEQYRGQVVLVVNLASKCGYTGQYANLQSLQKDYADKPFTVLGFPCNDFGGQEPGGRESIEACAAGYGADFPIMAKVQVKSGDGQSPVYRDLAAAMDVGPKWNFGKFLVGPDGAPVAFFGSSVKPDSAEVRAAIDGAMSSRAGGAL